MGPGQDGGTGPAKGQVNGSGPSGTGGRLGEEMGWLGVSGKGVGDTTCLLGPRNGFPLSVVGFRDSAVSSLRGIDFSAPSTIAARRFSVPAKPVPNGAVFNSGTGAVPNSDSYFVHKTDANVSLVSDPVP